jgi:hypothetical protein
MNTTQRIDGLIVIVRLHNEWNTTLCCVVFTHICGVKHHPTTKEPQSKINEDPYDCVIHPALGTVKEEMRELSINACCIKTNQRIEIHQREINTSEPLHGARDEFVCGLSHPPIAKEAR